MISARTRCEAHERIDLAWLSVGGTFDPRKPREWTYSSGLKIAAYPDTWSVVLEVDGVSQRIPLAYTATRFGSRRPWFTCPHCLTARRVLYRAASGFACRCCLDLRYASQIEDEMSRWTRRRRRLRDSLGAELSGPMPPKPKGMRWATYRAAQERDRELATPPASVVRAVLGSEAKAKQQAI